MHHVKLPFLQVKNVEHGQFQLVDKWLFNLTQITLLYLPIILYVFMGLLFIY